MNFKRVLVLVMALVMMVAVCAPAVSAVCEPETTHEHIEDLVSEYQDEYEELKATIEFVANDIEENHEETI